MEEKVKNRQDAIIQMIGSMAACDFSVQLETNDTSDALNVIAKGLNWLNEELEANVVEKSTLEEINKSLERFAFTAAHDMKSPLNSSIGLIGLIEVELCKCDHTDVTQYLNLLKETNQRSKNLIDGILDYSKTHFSSLEMKDVDLDALLHKVVKEYDSNTQVVINVKREMPVVSYHETALIQIFSNLIDNAINYNDKDTCEVQIDCIDDGDYYEISITDNGPGIAKEDEQKVFNLFENLKTQDQDSTGIGLATVKKIVTEMHGRIWVESTEDQGAKFVFTIVKNK